MQFQTVKEKQYHVRSKHRPDESSEECPICHKTYNKMYLKEHLTTHDENSGLKCIECGKQFSSKSNLNKHRKKHLPGYVPAKDKQREKKYGCLECGKKFDSMHGLEVCLFIIYMHPPLPQLNISPNLYQLTVVGLGEGWVRSSSVTYVCTCWHFPFLLIK